MKKEFVTYEQALQLKELGFDESCFGKYDIHGSFDHKLFYYNHDSETSLNCSAPTFSQAFRWFRERYDLSSWISGRTTMGFSYTIDASVGNFVYNTHEEAEQACLNNLIKIIKDGK